MKITVYTITDCQFSKQEKEYLKLHNLPFDEKNLETNKEFLTEMLTVSNNFAGTPVTKIEKDDGQIAILKGFTKEEFDQTLGFTPPPTAQAQGTGNTNTQGPTDKPAANTSSSTPPSPTPEPVKEPEKPAEEPKPETPPTSTPEPTTPPPPPTPQTPPATANPAPAADDPLNSILADLRTKSADQPEVPPQSPTSQTGIPSVPDFQK